jgi:hypothetical protein
VAELGGVVEEHGVRPRSAGRQSRERAVGDLAGDVVVALNVGDGPKNGRR